MIMRYLVTGGAGFIGSHLTEKLLGRGDEVTVIDDFNDYYDPVQKEKNAQAFKNHERVKIYRQDIRDCERLKEIFDNHQFDAVIHLAARAGVRASLKEPLLYVNVNVSGTANLLELSRLHHIKNFIFAGSSSVYGNQKKVPFSEDDALAEPLSVYAASKRTGEWLGHVYHRLHDLRFWSLRFFTVYGERGRPDMAPYLFTKLIDEEKPLLRYGHGKLERDFTYVGDILEGVISAIDRIGELGGYEIINLGHNKPVNLNYFINLIEDLLGRKAVIEDLDKPISDADVTCADISKAKRLLDFNPKISVEEGMAKFVKWYKENLKTF